MLLALFFVSRFVVPFLYIPSLLSYYVHIKTVIARLVSLQKCDLRPSTRFLTF